MEAAQDMVDNQDIVNIDESNDDAQYKELAENDDGSFDESEQEQEQEQTPESNEDKQQNNDADLPAQKKSEYENYKKMAAEERIRRREIEGKFGELAKQNNDLQRTLERIIEKANEQQAPSFDDDPIGALKAELDKTRKQTEELKGSREQELRQAREREAYQGFVGEYANQTLQYAKENPDFKEAYQYLVKDRYDEYIELGMNPNEAFNAVQQEEAGIAAKAMQDGVNPAERLHRLAMRRGYGKNGSTSGKIPVDERAKQIERGMSATSRAPSGGLGAQGKLTLESIASMDDAEFSKFDWNKIAQMMR